jgi:hypothetical protein
LLALEKPNNSEDSEHRQACYIQAIHKFLRGFLEKQRIFTAQSGFRSKLRLPKLNPWPLNMIRNLVIARQIWRIANRQILERWAYLESPHPPRSQA